MQPGPSPSIPSSQWKGVWHRGEFGQGRAPSLRAPKGSLDGSHRDADNLRGGNGRALRLERGTFLTRAKADSIKVARQPGGFTRREAICIATPDRGSNGISGKPALGQCAQRPGIPQGDFAGLWLHCDAADRASRSRVRFHGRNQAQAY
jgi:hypothetical protein